MSASISTDQRRQWIDAMLAALAVNAVELAGLLEKSPRPCVFYYDQTAKSGHVASMPPSMRRALCNSDHVTRRWVERGDGSIRVLVVAGGARGATGTLLLNYDPQSALWSVEPGSTSAAAARWAS